MIRFLNEINDLPEALLRIVAYYRREGSERLKTWAQKIKGREIVVFDGMGSSESAPLAITYKLAIQNPYHSAGSNTDSGTVNGSS